MPDGIPVHDPFERLDAKDGFHIVEVEFGDTLTLSCVAYAGGEMQNLVSDKPEDASIVIVEVANPSPAQRGAFERLRLALDGVARYLTTGGSWRELDMALNRMQGVASGGLKFPGYHLTTSYSTTEGTYQHVFTKDDGSGVAVLWEEPAYNASGGVYGGWIESTTLAKIREEQDNDELVWETGRVEETETPGQTDLLQLQPRESPEPPPSAPGGSGVRVPGQDPPP